MGKVITSGKYTYANWQIENLGIVLGFGQNNVLDSPRFWRNIPDTLHDVVPSSSKNLPLTLLTLSMFKRPADRTIELSIATRTGGSPLSITEKIDIFGTM